MNTLSYEELLKFKNQYCDENEKIISIIKSHLYPYFDEPILDVGCGIGDITYHALEHKKTHLVDIIDFTGLGIKRSENHIVQTIDFFDFKTKDKIETILLSHVLQHLDHNVSKLNQKVDEINPKYIIIVENQNNDFMKQIFDWAEAQKVRLNKEVVLNDFLIGFELKENIEFQAEVRCPDFDKLTNSIGRIVLDLDIVKYGSQLSDFFKSELQQPQFTINQRIKVYQSERK